MDKCPHGTPAGDVVAATAALRDEVAAAREKHAELQDQLVWALEKIDAVTEDNKTLGDLLSLLKNQTIELVHAEIDKLTESNQELKRIAKEQEKIEHLEYTVWLNTDWYSSEWTVVET